MALGYEFTTLQMDLFDPEPSKSILLGSGSSKI